jgi:hypothetical protein
MATEFIRRVDVFQVPMHLSDAGAGSGRQWHWRA